MCLQSKLKWNRISSHLFYVNPLCRECFFFWHLHSHSSIKCHIVRMLPYGLGWPPKFRHTHLLLEEPAGAMGTISINSVGLTHIPLFCLILLHIYFWWIYFWSEPLFLWQRVNNTCFWMIRPPNVCCWSLQNICKWNRDVLGIRDCSAGWQQRK